MENIEDNFIPVIAEPKIDGVSLSVSYRNGVLLRAATRGDGYVGDDVTKNIQAVEDIPKVLNSNAGLCPDFVEIRGEIYMLRTDFEELKMREKTDITKQFTLEFTDFKELNTQKKTGGKLKFSNPRNAASGALFHLTEQRPLKFFAYDWVTSESAISNSDHAVSVSRYRDMLERIKAWGIPVNPLYAYCETLKDVLDYYSMLVTQRMQEPYDMDGIVCKIDDLALRQRLGCRDRTPRWAIAYKFPAKRATTVLEEIKLQIGQTGTLTPVAILQPIDLGGASISRASLHNEKFIREKDLRVGDTVVIERAGDVIPYVIKVLDPARQGRSSPYQFPDLCPFCGADIVLDGEVRRCAGGIGCSAQAIERLRHFVSRRAFNILGLGKEQVRFLWNNGFVREFADIFTLEEHQSKVNHSGLGEKLTDYRDWAETYVDNLFYTIKCQRTIAFDRFLYALGIRNVGVVTAERIAAFYECWENFYQSTMESCRDNKPQEALISLNDIGSAVSESILDFFQDEKNCHEVLELCKPTVSQTKF
jgi:DNA ligase (NAD+)